MDNQTLDNHEFNNQTLRQAIADWFIDKDIAIEKYKHISKRIYTNVQTVKRVTVVLPLVLHKYALPYRMQSPLSCVARMAKHDSTVFAIFFFIDNYSTFKSIKVIRQGCLQSC